MSSTFKPATMVITFWKSLKYLEIFYQFFLSVKPSVIISNKMAHKSCLLSKPTIVVGL